MASGPTASESQYLIALDGNRFSEAQDAAIVPTPDAYCAAVGTNREGDTAKFTILEESSRTYRIFSVEATFR